MCCGRRRGVSVTNTWTNRPNPFNDTGDGEVVAGVCWSPELGLFVAVGSDNNFAITVCTSPDGITWTAQTNPYGPNGYALGVCWSPGLGLFVAVGNDDFSTFTACTSPDGITWTPQVTPFDGGAYASCVAWSETQSLFVLGGNDAGYTIALCTSPDGITWTAQTGGFDGAEVRAALWIDELSLWVVGIGGPAHVESIYTSPDAITWTAHTSAFDLFGCQGVGWSPSLSLVIATGSNAMADAVVTSPDGITWTTQTSPPELSGRFVIDANGTLVNGGFSVLGTSPLRTSRNAITWTNNTCPMDGLHNEARCGVYAPELGIAVVGGNGALAPDGSPVSIITSVFPDRLQVPPLWRYFIAALDGTGITDFSKLASDRVVEVLLNAPLSVAGTVPSDDPQVWIPYDGDGYRDPYLNEGTRLMWGLRQESNLSPYYTVRAATIVQLVEDSAEQDNARTSFTGWDPWHYMWSRPVCNADGSLPGQRGLSFTNTQVATIIETLLDNTFSNQGFIYIDLPDLRPDTNPNAGASGFWAGTIETGTGMAIDINFAQSTTVGEAMQQVCAMGVCDIVMNPIYDPVSRPRFLVELNVYAQAGVIQDEQIFAWNAPGRSLVSLQRLIEGSARANVVKFGSGLNNTRGYAPTETDAASTAKYGEYWDVRFLPGETVVEAVTSLAKQDLVLRAQGKTTVTFTPAPERSPRPWQDYGLGDRCPVYAKKEGFRQELGPTPALYFAQGYNAAPGDLWIFTGNYATDGDPDFVSLGPIGFSVNGIAINPRTSLMYGITSGGTPHLVSISLITGEGIDVGALGWGSVDQVGDVTFLPNGTMLALVLFGATSILVSVNLTTGVASAFGAEDFGDPIDDTGGLVYDYTSGYLFVAVHGTIFRVNATTGMIDEPAVTTNADWPVLALAQDTTGTMYLAYSAPGTFPTDDTHFELLEDFYNPGGAATPTFISEIQPGGLTDDFDAMCFGLSGLSYQRIYGWRANISDDALETVDVLLSEQGGFTG